MSKGPQPKHDITGLELGKMHVIKTDNPVSSRVILRKLAKNKNLRATISLGDGLVKLVLWNDKMLKVRK